MRFVCVLCLMLTLSSSVFSQTSPVESTSSVDVIGFRLPVHIHSAMVNAALFQADSDGNRSQSSQSHHSWRNLKKTGMVILGDAGYCYTPYLRPTWRGLAWFTGIAGAGVLIYSYDLEIYKAVQRNKNEPWMKWAVDTGTAFEWAGEQFYLIPAGLATMILGYYLDQPVIFRASGEILEAWLMAAPIKALVIATIGRERPVTGLGHRSYSWLGSSSFYSGHAVTVWPIAIILSKYIDSWPIDIGLYGIASAVSFQRIADRRHWPSDVYAGAIFGAVLAHNLSRRHDNLAIFPTVVDEQGSPGLSMRLVF